MPTRVDTFDDAYLDRLLRRVWTESLGYAGTEIVRRIIGFAHLTDLTTLRPRRRGVRCGWGVN